MTTTSTDSSRINGGDSGPNVLWSQIQASSRQLSLPMDNSFFYYMSPPCELYATKYFCTSVFRWLEQFLRSDGESTEICTLMDIVCSVCWFFHVQKPKESDISTYEMIVRICITITLTSHRFFHPLAPKLTFLLSCRILIYLFSWWRLLYNVRCHRWYCDCIDRIIITKSQDKSICKIEKNKLIETFFVIQWINTWEICA